MDLSNFKHLMISFFILFISSQLSKSSSLPFTSAGVNNITLFGDAYFLNNSIILTQEHNCTTTKPHSSTHATSLSGVGRAFLLNPIQFLDSSTNSTWSFSCKFSFTIISAPSWSSCPYGDGLAFLIVSNTDSFSLSDGYMGLPETDTDPHQDSFLAVEFDTNFDPYLDDINDNHIAIDVDGMSSMAAVDAASKDIDLKSGRELTVWIEYRGYEKLFLVWAGYNSQVKPSSPVLEAKIDLLTKFKEFMHVGFSASNGKGSAIHSVNHWKFKTSSSLSYTKMPIESVDEGDCLICKPEETNGLNHSSVSSHFSDTLLIFSLVFGGFSVTVSIVVGVVWVWFRKRRKRQKASNEGQLLMLPGSRVLERMSLSEIRAATKGFNQTRIIGTGASAVVYEGRIPSRGSVAVKRFSKESKFGQSSLACVPFNTEFATMVGCLRHKNLIQLQGWCSEKNELVLVYEYMANGSLDKILHQRTYFNKYLTWERRLNIVLGVASALIYLHEECESQIIHRDVKTCNIMLDDKFNAKLGDFGLAEVYGHDSETREATIPAGTMGYLAPEYAFSGIPTVKTDVYSFGIVVLEVISGRRPVDEEGTVITEWVWGLWEMRKLIEAADNKLMGRFDDAEMLRMLKVGLFCAHPDQEKRPTMKEAARMLTGEAPLPVSPLRKPTIKIQSVLPEGCGEIMKLGGELDGTSCLTGEAKLPVFPPKKLTVTIQSVFPESCEEIMKLGGAVDVTPWSTPLSHFSKN